MITVRVNSRDAVYTSDDLITSGSIGIPVRFILSSDFDGLSVVAVFVGSGASIDVALTGSCACVVPHEVLAQAGGYLRIGVYGRNGDGTIAIPTVWAEAKRILQGTEPSGVDPSEPTPDWTAQVQQMAADAIDLAQDVVDRADRGEFDGEQGPQGPKGDTGATGASGVDGVSPSVTVTDITGGHRVSVTDASGTITFDVMDGADGADGQPGQQGPQGVPGPGLPSGGTTGQVAVKASGTDYDVEWSDDLSDLKTEIEELPDIKDSTETDVDLDISDPSGNVILRLADGHIQTKNFDSSNIEADIAKDTVESGADLYICDASGNVIGMFANGHIITKNFNSANAGADIIKGTTDHNADLYITDSFGNVIAEFADGEIVTKNFDSGDYSDALSDISGLKTDVESIDERTTGVLYANKAFDDGAYAACKYKHAGNRQFCILIAGDCHTDNDSPTHFIEYLNAVDAFDCAVMLGDICGNVFGDTIEHYTRALAIAQRPVVTVLGNHDVRGATSDSELWTRYGALFDYADLSSGEAVDGKCYYYKDFVSQKVRLIVLMQYDYIYTGELCFGQSQIDWLIDVLEDTPSDYGVIIAEHTNPSRYMTYNLDPEYTSSTWYQSNYAPTVMSGDPVPDIINAWINGGTLTQTYAYTYDNPPAALSVDVDFTSRGAGEFITYLGGHWHQNVLGYVTGHSDQMDFHVQACSSIYTTASGDIPRKKGTVSEDSFCALAVDREKKTVKIFQVGAHLTYDAVNRQYFKYAYGA